MDAAVEQYGFCPDVIDQGPEEATVVALADVLRQSTVWYFWWDYGSLRVIKEFFSAFVQPLEERNKAERAYRLPKPRQK